MELKPFQQTALDHLRGFLSGARETGDLRAAFEAFRAKSHMEGMFTEYRPLAGLEGTPYCCLRLPTGGGKTLLGALVVGVAAESYLDRSNPLVVWLVPSDAIRAQTAKALNDPEHPYRRALGGAFEGRVRVFDIRDFAQLKPQDLRGNACVVVATMASLRVERTEGRKVYAHNENLEGHFTAERRQTQGLEPIEEGKAGAGGPKYSFANLLRSEGTLVVVDEAHQFMTDLSQTVLERIGARVVVELTATPDADTNVLYRASAAELRDAEMIKLPVVLKEHGQGWQDCLCEAVATRRSLEQSAAGEAEYIRPILLVQAQNKGKDADVETVKAHLIENKLVRAEELAVHTGDRRELEGVDLRRADCPITTVLTVKALVEGWDCPFAYVLCSTANIGSPKDVEQLLGRVLRMPYARKRKAGELNKAYAHVTSERFGAAAGLLGDSLLGWGLEPGERAAAVEEEGRLPLLEEMEPRPVLRVELAAEPEWALVPPREIFVRPIPGGGVAVEARGFVSQEAAERIAAGAPEERRAAVREQIAAHNERLSPAERGRSFLVPVLETDVNGEPELWSSDALTAWLEWRLLDYPAELDRGAFDETNRMYTLDLQGRHFAITPLLKEAAQMELPGSGVDLVRLLSWLDRKLHEPWVSQGELAPWLLRALETALKKPVFSVELLDRGRYVLLRLLREQMEGARRKAWAAGYEELLFGTMRVVTSGERSFRFPEQGEYLPKTWCKSMYRFQKHYYAPGPGEMKGSGEEFRCAKALDEMPEVEFWVRNLEGQSRVGTSFWLQTKTDRFYPDFVAQMKDGRVFVVEYKGEDRATNEDSEEKRKLGEVWAARGNGDQVFAMVWEGVGRPEIGRQLRAALRVS